MFFLNCTSIDDDSLEFLFSYDDDELRRVGILFNERIGEHC